MQEIRITRRYIHTLYKVMHMYIPCHKKISFDSKSDRDCILVHDIVYMYMYMYMP